MDAKAEHRSTYRWSRSGPVSLPSFQPLIGICLGQPEIWSKPTTLQPIESRLPINWPKLAIGSRLHTFYHIFFNLLKWYLGSNAIDKAYF